MPMHVHTQPGDYVAELSQMCLCLSVGASSPRMHSVQMIGLPVRVVAMVMAVCDFGGNTAGVLVILKYTNSWAASEGDGNGNGGVYTLDGMRLGEWLWWIIHFEGSAAGVLVTVE